MNENIQITYHYTSNNNSITNTGELTVFENFADCWGVTSLDYFYGCVVKNQNNEFQAYFGPDEDALEHMDIQNFSEEKYVTFKEALMLLLNETHNNVTISSPTRIIKTVEVNTCSFPT